MRLVSKIPPLLGLIAAASLVNPPPARAAFTTTPQVVTIAPTDAIWHSTGSPDTSTPGTYYQPFTKFGSTPHGDASILTGVVLNVSYTVESPWSATFQTPADLSFLTQAGLTLTLPDGTPIVANQTLFDEFESISGVSGQTFSENRTHSGSLAPIALTDPAILKLFEGPGTISFPISTTALTGNLENSGNVTRIVQTRVGVTLSISYLAEAPAIPEPSGMVLMGLGGGGAILIGGLRRRRQGRNPSPAAA